MDAEPQPDIEHKANTVRDGSVFGTIARALRSRTSLFVSGALSVALLSVTPERTIVGSLLSRRGSGPHNSAIMLAPMENGAIGIVQNRREHRYDPEAVFVTRLSPRVSGFAFVTSVHTYDGVDIASAVDFRKPGWPETWSDEQIRQARECVASRPGWVSSPEECYLNRGPIDEHDHIVWSGYLLTALLMGSLACFPYAMFCPRSVLQRDREARERARRDRRE